MINIPTDTEKEYIKDLQADLDYYSNKNQSVTIDDFVHLVNKNRNKAIVDQVIFGDNSGILVLVYPDVTINYELVLGLYRWSIHRDPKPIPVEESKPKGIIERILGWSVMGKTCLFVYLFLFSIFIWLPFGVEYMFPYMFGAVAAILGFMFIFDQGGKK